MATKNENPVADAAKKTGEAVKDTAKKAEKKVEEGAKTIKEGVKDTAKKAEKVTKDVVQTTQASGKKVEHNVTHVEAQSSNQEELQHITKGNALPFRILAIVLWLLALGCEVVAILLFLKKITFPIPPKNPIPNVWQAVIFLAIDLILLIVGSQMWKKANHTDPASKKNTLAFWLQNNLGVIVAAVAFIPFIIIALTDKNASKQDKTIAAIAAAVALAVGVLTGIDYNPVSQEDLQAEQQLITSDVYWTAGGGVYHTHLDCGHLANSVNVAEGNVTAAIEHGKTRLCKTCAAKDSIELPSDAVEDLGEVVENAAD